MYGALTAGIGCPRHPDLGDVADRDRVAYQLEGPRSALEKLPHASCIICTPQPTACDLSRQTHEMARCLAETRFRRSEDDFGHFADGVWLAGQVAGKRLWLLCFHGKHVAARPPFLAAPCNRTLPFPPFAARLASACFTAIRPIHDSSAPSIVHHTPDIPSAGAPYGKAWTHGDASDATRENDQAEGPRSRQTALV